MTEQVIEQQAEENKQIQLEEAPEFLIESNLYKLNKLMSNLNTNLGIVKADIEKLEAELERREELKKQPKEEVVAEEPAVLEGEVIPAQG